MVSRIRYDDRAMIKVVFSLQGNASFDSGKGADLVNQLCILSQFEKK